MIKNSTYFVDIDGTIIKYRQFDKLLQTKAEPIQEVIDSINEEYDKGSHIVVTSARPIEYLEFTKKELKKIRLKHHQVILGIGRGTRFVINDIDPDNPTIKRAVGINLIRDKGYQGIL
jgi:histidinol phosphatase-like enzyme